MEKDLQKKGYFHDPERFADLINGVICSGRRVIEPSDLTDVDSQTGFYKSPSKRGAKGTQRKQRYRDLVRKAAFGVNFAVVGIENQEDVHYLMPLRSMAYDVAEYERQAAIIRRKVRRRKDITSAEFLSGFKKDSRLHPCVTLILYYGEEWDGARDLHSILDFTDIPQELRDKVNDYHIQICEVRKFQNTDVFQTDLKQVFDWIRYSENRKKLQELVMNDPVYRELDEDAYDVIAAYTDMADIMEGNQKEQKGDRINMCGAIREMIEEGKEEGREEGREQAVKALIETCMEFGRTKEETEQRILTKLEVPEEVAKRYIEQYWPI